MIPLKGRRIVLIGGAGFIGHNLAIALKREGAEVSVVDGLTVNNLLHFTSSNEVLKNAGLYRRIINQRLDLLREHEIPLYVQDARDYINLSHVLNKIEPQVVVQLAAVAHANKSNKDPYSTFDHSLRTLENALDHARGSSVEHFIYFSSSMVYGNFADGAVTEETPCEPLGIYGALKFAGEKLVIAYNQVFDLPYTIVRPSALYGERCVSRRVGQVFIENAMEGKELKVMGNGQDRLDFTYIGDLVHGILCCMREDRARNQIFNLTFGQGRSIEELAHVLREVFPDIHIVYEPRDSLMPERGTLCVDKAKRMIGYEPSYPLERGFREYIEWYRAFWPTETAYAGRRN
jgi:nucleoside-diphosphate-sugar epimerase